VLTEPQAGIGPIYKLITRARTSIDLTRYELAAIVTTKPAVVAAVSTALAGDYAGAARYSPPAPAVAASKPASGGSLCGAPANPFHLSLCAGGRLVTTAPSGVCGYFSCIGNFANGQVV
jgi:hypothetical protein